MSFAHTTPLSQPEQDPRFPFSHLRPNSAWYCYRARVQQKTRAQRSDTSAQQDTIPRLSGLLLLK